MVLYGLKWFEYEFVWILVCPISRVKLEFIITLDLLKVGLVKP